MPITIKCPHCKTAELEKVPDKSPDGHLKCPKCGCTFRVCLAIFDKECYGRMYPKPLEGPLHSDVHMPKKVGRPKKEKVEWMGGPMQELPEEKKE